MAVTAPSREPWAGLFRPLERDERLFAVLLAFVMVGGLATLGLLPLRPRYRVDVYAVVIWFGLYKAGILALVTREPAGHPPDLHRAPSASISCSSSPSCS